jgi:hypothetical protein
MKALILAIAAVALFPGLALAHAADVRDRVQMHDPAFVKSDSQASGAVSEQESKIAMGPTSAPQKPGGTGGVGGGPTGPEYRHKQHPRY